MGARKAAMKRKALKLILPGYEITFRDLMRSYRFWQRVIKLHPYYDEFACKKAKARRGYGKKNRRNI